MSLSLVLVPQTMDKRSLSCLFVFESKVTTVEVRGRGTLVLGLQLQLCQFLGGTICANDLRVFLARRGGDSDSKWLLHESADACTLTLGRDTSEAEVAAARYFTMHNFMEPRKSLLEFFPAQPRMYDGVSTAIHVLVCHTRTVIPRPLEAAREEESPGWVNLLVESLVNATSEAANGRGHRVAGNMPVVIRCANDVGMLWLDDEDDDSDKSSMYVPRAWRQVSTEVFKWAITNPTMMREERGRRAILTGAPRVGKSAFVGFILLQLLKLRSPPVCILDVPGLTFSRIDPIRLAIDEGARGAAFRADLMDKRTVYIYDVSGSMADLVGPLSAKEVCARSIITLPHRYVPRHSTRNKTFVLPLWTPDDLKEAVFSCRTSLGMTKVTALMHKWGGVPGRVLTHDTERSVAQLESALSQITARKVKIALAGFKYPGAWGKIACSDDGASWRSLVVITSSSVADFVHTGEVAFTSQYVCDRVLALTTQRTWVVREFVPATMARLQSQLRKSLEYLAREEDEKNETPWALAVRKKGECRWQWERAWV